MNEQRTGTDATTDPRRGSRKPYATPRVVTYGTLSELTRAQNTGPSDGITGTIPGT